jgi:hypothetical protein
LVTQRDLSLSRLLGACPALRRWPCPRIRRRFGDSCGIANLSPHGEERRIAGAACVHLAAMRVSNHVAHPSRRPLTRAPQDEVEFAARSQCQTAMHDPPVFGQATGAPVFSFPARKTNARGRSAERRGMQSRRITPATPCKLVCDGRDQAAGLRDPLDGASPLGAPRAAILGLGTVLPGTGQGAPEPLIGRLSPPLSVPRPAIEGSPT